MGLRRGEWRRRRRRRRGGSLYYIKKKGYVSERVRIFEIWEGFDRGWDSMVGWVRGGYGWAESIRNAENKSNEKILALISGSDISTRRCIYSDKNERTNEVKM